MAETIGTYPEGEASSDAGPGQIQDRSRALFKLGQDGEVQSLGIELESAMVAKASKAAKRRGVAEEVGQSTKEGEKEGDEEKTLVHDWDAIEKGMIWFERVRNGS